MRDNNLIAAGELLKKKDLSTLIVKKMYIEIILDEYDEILIKNFELFKPLID